MGLDLFNTTVESTYDGLLKTSDNDNITGIAKQITDGNGNNTPLWISTTRIGVGVAPDPSHDFTTNLAKVNTLNSQYLNSTAGGSVVLDSIQLTGGIGTQGQMAWNADEETVDLINNGAVLQLGQEIHIHVRNNSATVAIPNGTPVYVAGTLGASGRLKVAPMIADGSIPSEYFLGVTTEEIEPDGDGKVTWFGKVRDFDTSLLGEATKLYVSETVAGGWQTNHPTSPNPKLEVAFTVNAKSNGTVFIRANNGYKLDDLHDVEIVLPANGDLLVYNSALGRWENSKTIGDLTAANLTATSFIKSGGTSSQFLKADGSVDSTTYQDTTEKGQALGYAPLDSGGKIAEAYLPDSVVGQVEYQGTWNATTNTPTLPDPTTVKGHFYIVSVSGNYLTIDYQVGDWIISNGVDWSKVDNTDAVTTFNGRLGSIIPLSTDYDSFFYTKTLLDAGQLDNRYYTETETNNFFSGTTAITGYNKTNWDAAFGWGNHATFGYLTAEADTLASVTGRGATTTNTITINASSTGQPLILKGVVTTVGSIPTELQFYGAADGTFSLENHTGSTYGQSGIDISSRETQFGGIRLYQGTTTIGDFKSDGIDLITTAIAGTLDVSGVTTLASNAYLEGNTYFKDTVFMLDANGSSYSTVVYRDGINPHVLMAGGGTSTQWNTAYGWGDHSTQGYLTSYTETDPIYTASSWYTTTNNSTNWNTAYGWGNWATGVTKTFVDNLNVDADTLDGLDSNSFLRSDAADTASSTITFTSTSNTGTGDRTNEPTPTYKINVSGFWRIPHLSSHLTASGVYNYETGKDVYWGEETDTGNYYFRGRNLNVVNGTITGNGNGLTNVNATTLDSLDSSQFLRSDTSDTMYGNLTIDRGANLSSFLYLGSSTSNYLALGSNQLDHYWRADGSHYFEKGAGGMKGVWNTGGNLGIGTTSPSSKLNVSSSDSFRTIEVNGNNPAIYFKDDNGQNAWHLGHNGSTLYVLEDTDKDGSYNILNGLWNSSGYQQYTGNIDIRVGDLTVAGNVGIGTSSPLYKAHLSSGDASEIGFQATNTGGGHFRVGTGSTVSGFGGALRIYDVNASAERMHIDSSGNVGIGVSPENSAGTWRNFQIGGGNIVSRFSNANDFILGTGFYFNTANGELYKNTEAVSRLFFNNDIISFQNAPSGTAGTGITWAERMQVNANGQLLIGDNVSPSSVWKGTAVFGKNGTDKVIIGYLDASPNENIVGGHNSALTAWADLSLAGTNLIFRYNGTTEGMRLNSSGNVGIGTTAPIGKLNINTGLTGNTVDVINQASGTISFANGSGGTAVPNIVSKSSNNLGLNIISVVPNVPAAGLDMAFDVRETDNTDFATLTSSAFRFSRFGNSLVEIKRNGNVGIGTTSPAYKLDVAGTIRATGDVIAYSDVRVKENIKTIPNALDSVNKMRGVLYNKIGEEKQSTGVIAQEIEKILPQVVSEDENGMKSVAYGNIVGVLIEAIKEQQEQIDELKRRLDNLV